jgi:hypothetical protein
MLRAVASVVGGLFAWVVVVTLLNFVLRAILPGYHAAEATLQFTLAMKVGRLIIAGLTSLVAGAVVHLIAPARRWAPWAVGLILLALFVPEHVKLWNRFPLWYHLTFLVTLAPLVALGALLIPKNNAVGDER